MESKDKSICSTSGKIIEILLDQGNGNPSANTVTDSSNNSSSDPTQLNFYNPSI